MREFICNTSPFQYLHQLGALEILRDLTGGVIVPPSVQTELDDGQRAGHELPDLTRLDWVSLRRPESKPVLPLAADLGPGESAVLAEADSPSEEFLHHALFHLAGRGGEIFEELPSVLRFHLWSRIFWLFFKRFRA